MPDTHSTEFWTSVASTFKDNPAVVFDAFNEPFSPAAVNDPSSRWTGTAGRWAGCLLPSSKDGDSPDNNNLYAAVGLQTLVNTIRATGATQPILLGGLSYANDLSEWLAHEPADPLPSPQLAASFHNYQREDCETQACWDRTIAPVAAQVPVVTGEFDQDVCRPSAFDDSYMTWADQHGIGYLAWGWWVLSAQEIKDAGCNAFYLITNPSGTPADPNGTALHDHLAALASGSAAGSAAGRVQRQGQVPRQRREIRARLGSEQQRGAERQDGQVLRGGSRQAARLTRHGSLQACRRQVQDGGVEAVEDGAQAARSAAQAEGAGHDHADRLGEAPRRQPPHAHPARLAIAQEPAASAEELEQLGGDLLRAVLHEEVDASMPRPRTSLAHERQTSSTSP